MRLLLTIRVTISAVALLVIRSQHKPRYLVEIWKLRGPSQPATMVEEKLKSFNCEKCVFSTNYKHCLNQHVKNIHLKSKDIRCQLCSYSTNIPGSLTRHIKVTHLGIKKFLCRKCNYVAATSLDLDSHRNRHKEKELDQLNCMECSKSFISRQGLVKHVSVIHNKIRAHKCSLCDFESSQQSNLNVHMRVHTGATPYTSPRRCSARLHLQRPPSADVRTR